MCVCALISLPCCVCRQEEEKRKQQELHKKREERQRKKRVELDLQKDLWSPQDEVEMGGAEQVEGGIDQMWSTDQRGIHMPWPGVPVSSPVGALSLLEIQEQEFKHAEQKVRGGGGGDRQSRKENSCSSEYMHTYVYVYIRTYIHTYICTYIHTYVYMYIHTYIHACICVVRTLPLSICECSCVAESVYHVNFHHAVIVDC